MVAKKGARKKTRHAHSSVKEIPVKKNYFSVYVGVAILIVVLGSVFLLNLMNSPVTGYATQTGGLTQLGIDTINGIIEISKTALMPLLGESDTGIIFMAKLLIIIILISFISAILPNAMPQLFTTSNRYLLWIVSIAVSLLGVRALNSSLIYTILIPNETFAIAIASIIPFLLYFYIVEFGALFMGSFARRTAWIFFAVVFLGVYTLRVNELGEVAFIYPLTALVAFIMAIMDGTIQSMRNKWREEKAREETKGAKRAVHYNKLREKTKEYNDSVTTGVPYIGGTLSSNYPGASASSDTGSVAFDKDSAAIWDVIHKIRS